MLIRIQSYASIWLDYSMNTNQFFPDLSYKSREQTYNYKEIYEL